MMELLESQTSDVIAKFPTLAEIGMVGLTPVSVRAKHVPEMVTLIPPSVLPNAGEMVMSRGFLM